MAEMPVGQVSTAMILLGIAARAMAGFAFAMFTLTPFR